MPSVYRVIAVLTSDERMALLDYLSHSDEPSVIEGLAATIGTSRYGTPTDVAHELHAQYRIAARDIGSLARSIGMLQRAIRIGLDPLSVLITPHDEPAISSSYDPAGWYGRMQAVTHQLDQDLADYQNGRSD